MKLDLSRLNEESDLQVTLDVIEESLRNSALDGEVASYIPELKKVSPENFAISVCNNDGSEYSCGNYTTPFSIQSISKVFVLALAMQIRGDDLWKRVGREPSGNAFNSLVQLENENGIPRNPFINAGALVTTDAIVDSSLDPIDEIVHFVRSLSGNNEITYNRNVAQSEYDFGERNAALAYFMKSFGNIDSEVDRLLRVYFAHCSLEMTTLDLARAFQVFAHSGFNPSSQEHIIPVADTKRINAMMMTCGLYDNVGDFAYRVGLPAKSGVGGGIVAVLPNNFSIAVWSPGLNSSGNSLRGTKALELFTEIERKSIF